MERITGEKVVSLIKEIKALKAKIREKEQELAIHLKNASPQVLSKYSSGLQTEEIVRYSRQMLVDGIGIDGQLKLKNSKVLIVGVGGLGCPSALYLASSGIGEITLVDYDDVEISNLHRQILHTEDDVGIPKVNSAYDKLHSINRSVRIIPIKEQMDSNSIKKLIGCRKFDLVIDGSDNVATRYLLNDACVLYGVPLVSGSALQTEAQLTVYNYKGGPCYRCLFPVPPPPECVTSCGDGGVIPPVPGVIGVLQALEAIKILTGSGGVLSQRLLLFDGSTTTFRNVKLRPRNQDCAVCGDNPTVKELIDYEQFCRASAHDKVIDIDILNDSQHINIKELPEKLGTKMVLDVRPKIQFEMCRLEGTVNVPYDDIQKPSGLEAVSNLIKSDTHKEVYVLCRRGNDSQRTVNYLNKQLSDLGVKFFNVKGGLYAYSKNIDSKFPVF